MSAVSPLQNQTLESASTYRSVFVPVDNSPYSNRAVDLAIQLGRQFDSTLTGCHVYAAKMHDYRFKQMEYTLPEEYLQEQEIERQRKIHDSLITMGLELISDCYLEDMDRKCQDVGIAFRRKMMDGKHSTELVRDIAGSDYDLVVLGALGIGKVRDSQIGSVCERVSRSVKRDVWVVKHVPGPSDSERDTILVGIDGSPQSFGALMTAIDLARRFDKKIELISVYDPYLHYAVFKGIVDVLTEKASKVFRFEEQNQLHEEIIDTGLAQIYQSHLNVAQVMAREAGMEVTTTLLDGKAFQKILDHARKTNPWLLIVGRIGVHSTDSETSLGSNSENLLRLCSCDILLSTRIAHAELDLKAEQAIHWTREAEERMKRVPDMVRGIARTAILRLAVEKGHSVVTNSLVTEAMDRFMPKSASRTTTGLAEALALEKARKEPVSICRKCGLAARVPDPVQCSVCGADDFDVVTPEMIERIASMEGGVEEETTYDGRKVKWTQEARRTLYAIEDKYLMRRCKARIEKKARINKVEAITVEFARTAIEEESGNSFLPPGALKLSEPPPAETAEPAEAMPVVATDPKGTPLLSHYLWTEEAVQRLFRVPSGFMRNRTQERIEELAGQRSVEEIDLGLVEDGIEHGRQMMAEMIAQYSKPQNGASDQAPKTQSQNGNGSGPSAECPAEASPSKGLNETGWMSEMAKKRKALLE